jgi:hypothetical protein
VPYFKWFFLHAGLGLFAVLAPLVATAARAEHVRCHYTYGGETKRLLAPAVSSPYGVKGIQIGSRFELRVIFQDRPADVASIKIYAYADRDDEPVLMHQATYPYPPTSRRAARYGFSGLHSLYEPQLESELQYWCELVQAPPQATR